MKKAVPPVSQTSGPVINVHVDTRILTLIIQHSLTVYPVAVGKTSTPTPPGHWKIVFKSVNPGGPFGARWMRLSVPWGSYGIHGTNNPKSIGKAVSHGCIRLYNEDVVVVYRQVPVGTPVNIDGVVRKIRTLKQGCKGDDVRQVQSLLQDLGEYTASVDGWFGPLTRQAVIRFKRAQELKATALSVKTRSRQCKSLMI
jgi:lipoprotein-anchoring transpeptidase ErfK/SrfK